ncbi:hypothetical protein [Halobacillus mangrovi]|uniref:hypothetical protein n=1 Tax=Halobacillus mangrovi TaxID=402384 RepID=UPI003D98A8C4
MSRIYSDYFNQTVLTIPDTFIDVKTGETHHVSPKINEEIEYHSMNNTLQHLIFSALHSYFQQKQTNNESTNDLLLELLEIKKMLNHGNRNSSSVRNKPIENSVTSEKVDLKEIEDLLEAFGG